MLQGIVVKAAGGFFTVRDDIGKEFVCRARGVLKRGQATLIIGDRVYFSAVEDTSSRAPEGIIEKVLPRKNSLYRPPIANVDQLAIIMSLKSPPCDWQLVSRLLVLAEKEDLSAFICLNKSDLVKEKDITKINELLQPYPYSVLFTSALKGEGIDLFRDKLAGRSSVLAGPSGVGKSSMLNALQPGLSLQTGTVSDKIKRGKHTTRQAELLALNFGGLVADTPGFTRLDFSGIEPAELSAYFPEYEPFEGQCGFRDCVHLTEPECAVRDEVGRAINKMRYEHYKYFMEELNKQEAY
ncbi:MAG: ribosome small subunit-dependent GTPase A [Bacillota bacterium]|nr:ribosome small subunit-dependent GTPase A [Bacillota bacterium]